MFKERKYFWIAPLLGGMLSLISLLTPATYLTIYNQEIYIWMWGLGSFNYFEPFDPTGGEFRIEFIRNKFLLSSSIICSFLVLFCAIVLLILANLYRIGKREFNEVKKSWYCLSVLLIITTAIWMIIYEVVNFVETSESWWDVMDPGFGVIGIFFGAMISIIGTAIANYLIRRKQGIKIPSIKKQQYMIPPSADQGSYKTRQISTPKFCPMCGNKVMIRDSKFCLECGFEFGKRI
jgi:hypothetical protein